MLCFVQVTAVFLLSLVEFACEIEDQVAVRGHLPRPLDFCCFGNNSVKANISISCHVCGVGSGAVTS